MVAQKLAGISLQTRTKLWHHSTLWLYKYLAFVKI